MVFIKKCITFAQNLQNNNLKVKGFSVIYYNKNNLKKEWQQIEHLPCLSQIQLKTDTLAQF